MNPKFFGDSYDLAKRFFCGALAALDYDVIIDPMFTGEWNGKEKSFYKLIGARPAPTTPISSRHTALFLDPDTGIRERAGKQYVTFDRIVAELQKHSLVFAFDQAFNFQTTRLVVIREKLAAIRNRDCHGFYYDSHAKFLFVSRETENLKVFTRKLLELGLPESRLFQV